jgi:hypothetical protein
VLVLVHEKMNESWTRMLWERLKVPGLPPYH